jgi:hypothetical protein
MRTFSNKKLGKVKLEPAKKLKVESPHDSGDDDDFFIGIKQGESRFEVKEWEKFKGKKTPREDGREWTTEQDEGGYFEKKWVDEQEERRRIIESNPDHIFLTLVAGKSNSVLEAMFEEADLTTRIRRERAIQLQQQFSIEEMRMSITMLEDQVKNMKEEIGEMQGESRKAKGDLEPITGHLHEFKLAEEDHIYYSRLVLVTELLNKILTMTHVDEEAETTLLKQIADTMSKRRIIRGGKSLAFRGSSISEWKTNVLRVLLDNYQKIPIPQKDTLSVTDIIPLLSSSSRELSKNNTEGKQRVQANRQEFARTFRTLLMTFVAKNILDEKGELRVYLNSLSGDDEAIRVYELLQDDPSVVPVISNEPITEYFTPEYTELWKRTLTEFTNAKQRQAALKKTPEDLQEFVRLEEIIRDIEREDAWRIYIRIGNWFIRDRRRRVELIEGELFATNEEYITARNRLRRIRKGEPVLSVIPEPPYAHRRGWRMAPENTGIVRLKPVVVSAISKAFNTIKRASDIDWRNRVDIEFLQHDKEIQDDFAELCAIYVSIYAQRFPKQYLQLGLRKVSNVDLHNVMRSLKKYTISYNIEEGKNVARKVDSNNFANIFAKIK